MWASGVLADVQIGTARLGLLLLVASLLLMMPTMMNSIQRQPQTSYKNAPQKMRERTARSPLFAPRIPHRLYLSEQAACSRLGWLTDRGATTPLRDADSPFVAR